MAENVSNNIKINKINTSSNQEIESCKPKSDELPSIFGFNDLEEPENVNFEGENKEVEKKPETTKEQTKSLEKHLTQIKNEQGWLSNVWDGIKSNTGIGSSSKKCEQTIEKFKNGKISYEEAMSNITEFSANQKESVNLISNVLSGLSAVGTAVAAGALVAGSGGTAAPVVLLALGTGAGAVTKAGLKFSDRATNNIDGDALDGKQILKDGLSGAVDGAASVATMGIGTAGMAAGATVKSAVINGAKSGAQAGAISGAMTGAGDYTIETVMEEDAEFNIKDFTETTFTNAAAGVITGGIIGGAASGMVKGKTVTNLTEDATQRTLTSELEKANISSKTNNINKTNEKNTVLEKNEISDIKSASKQTKVKTEEQIQRAEKAKQENIAKFTKAKAELSENAHKMFLTSKEYIEEATEQIERDFASLESTSKITGRPKKEDSTLKKLVRKYRDKEFPTDIKTCTSKIGDAYGTRIQMTSLPKEDAKVMIEDCLEGYNISYSEFCAFAKGDNSGLNAEKKAILREIKGPIIELLKEKQSQEVVNKLIEAITRKENRLNISELNNYGDELSSYFSTKQVQQIADAYKDATGKKLPIVNRQKIDEGQGILVEEEGTNGYKSSVDTTKAIKPSGYTSAQMNVTHEFNDGTKGLGELQIRGTSVNELADVEHIPYDIRQGKITFEDKKYRDIFRVIKGMGKSTYKKYNRFLTQTYHCKRLNELGIPADPPNIKDVFRPGEIPNHAYDLLSVEGLVKISQRE